jgi:Pre ATP-grasp domain/PGM1 C-terminal domain/Carbamoyl-phosphate synthase L chain, ATP binding domain
MKVEAPMQRIIFANIVNELMIDRPSLEYAQKMNVGTPRKIWLAQPGDVVITPVKIGSDLRSYAERIRDQDLSSVDCYCPGGADTLPLAERVRADPKLMSALRTLPEAGLLPFCADRPTLSLAEQLGCRVLPYATRPSEKVLATSYLINTKAGFRERAAKLGLSVVPGEHCRPEQLVDAVMAVGARARPVIVKANRSSNGYGHKVIEPEDQDVAKVRTAIEPLFELFGKTAPYVVEQYMDFVGLPSVEVEVDDAGPHVMYVCDQRCRNNAWTGMSTPPMNRDAKYVAALKDVGMRFGRSVYEEGFRGIFDVDCGVGRDGTVYVSESNFRRTGGTYLHQLLQRLLGDAYQDERVWIADACAGTPMNFLDAAGSIRESGLEFDRVKAEGVILTADTVRFDGKWRYLIVAADHDRAGMIEQKLARHLGLSDVTRFYEHSNARA